MSLDAGDFATKIILNYSALEIVLSFDALKLHRHCKST